MVTKLRTPFAPVQTATAKAAARTTAQNSDAQRKYAESVAAAQDEYLAAKKVPSVTRQLCTSIAQAFVATCNLYWGIQVSGWLMTAALVYTGSAFLSFCIGVLAMFLSLKVAWDAGVFVADMVFNYDVDALASAGHELRVASARRVSLVKKWFTRSDEPIANPAA